FHEMDVDQTGLMNRPQAAHLTIFVTSARILDSVEESSDDRDEIFWFSALRGSYARDYWIQHLLEIDVEEVPDADAKCVIESLYTIFKLHGEALNCIGENGDDNIFGSATDMQDNFFKALNSWSIRASKFTSDILSSDVQQFME